MKSVFTLFLLHASFLLFSQNSIRAAGAVSPLAIFSSEWNQVKYSKCNTAVNAAYLSKSEKEVIYILNLIRTYPALFARTVLKQYPGLSGNGYLADDTYYYKSLVDTLLLLQPMNMLYPDKSCFNSAKSHAYQSGISGYVGHERKTPDSKLKKHYYGECCDYGRKDALEIVLSLLIDEGIPSLGHRDICLSSYTKVGVSIQPHKKYGTNAVLDFIY
ncbi:MAG: hypothetical protein IPL54_14305 [Chitinophagaceae bacterium]|nr:hypothetical protein [Chitinophagaceae bacterium]